MLESKLDDPVEFAAIQAGDRPVRHVRNRMTSWADVADEPMPGDFCGCCAGILWWTKTAAPLGWRCTWCHPPNDLPAGQFRVPAT
jgi:hypothetical protein